MQEQSCSLSCGVSRLNFTLNDGFLISQYSSQWNAGPRPGVYLAPRTTMDFGAVAKAKLDAWSATAVYLNPNEVGPFETNRKLAGLNVRYTPSEPFYVDASVVRAVQSDMIYRTPSGPVGTRAGLTMIAALLRWADRERLPGVWVEAEAAHQGNSNFPMNAYAGYMTVGYIVRDLPWSPSLSPRGSVFSGDNPATATFERFDSLDAAVESDSRRYRSRSAATFRRGFRGASTCPRVAVHRERLGDDMRLDRAGLKRRRFLPPRRTAALPPSRGSHGMRHDRSGVTAAAACVILRQKDHTMTPYPHLLSPLRLGHLTSQSRVVMGAMHTGLEERGDWHQAARFYARRAEGGVGLIVTGGIAPNREGGVFPGASGLYAAKDIANHRQITDAVHKAGGLIAMQILHAGRYAFGEDCVSASAIRSPISPFTPAALDDAGIEKQIVDIATTAERAREAGYDGVEVMGSEGYFLNQFLSQRVNRRVDAWGGSAQARMRLPLEVVRRIRERVGRDFLLIYRISLADLVPEGSIWADTMTLARALDPDVDLFTSGIGWHEARVPTIAASVPRGAFVALTARLRAEVSVPVAAANRINTAELAEDILASGQADLVALARPLLADPDFVAKARAGRADRIAPCIACNQACLDHTFSGKLATCLVNPAACREAEFEPTPALRRRIAVVGGGAAGMACAATAAERGHAVVLFEKTAALGGQMRLAAQVPGKAEFRGLIEWFALRLADAGVELHLDSAPTAQDLAGFDAVVLATGVKPRRLDLPGGVEAPDYAEVLSGRALGPRVAVIGAGGIGFDVATALVGGTEDLAQWRQDWGVGDPALSPGGLAQPDPAPSLRKVWLLQRKAEKPGRGLGRTTGWIHRAHLAAKGVHMLGGVEYLDFSPAGLRIRRDGSEETLPVDDIVFCTGQVAEPRPAAELAAQGIAFHPIGGAAEAQGIDAKRAIEEGVRLALAL